MGADEDMGADDVYKRRERFGSLVDTCEVWRLRRIGENVGTVFVDIS
jgi:hypothetical protein